eukprot:134321_1
MSTTLVNKHKYPKEYCCCNDTIIGCGLLCCKKCDKYMEEDVLNTETDAQNVLIWEKTVDKIVETINKNWSWASAGLLAAACQATIVFNQDDISDVASKWLYFCLIFLAGVLAALLEHSFESPETIAQELELTVPKKKAALGDKDAIQQANDRKQKAETVDISNDKKSAMRQILNFVKVEGNQLLENTENLFIAIISNVVALALNVAVTATFKAIVEGSKAEGIALITAQWIYVIVLLFVVCYASLHIGKLVDKLDIEMHDKLIKNGLENSKKDLLGYSTRKRVFKLMEHSLSLVLAWALQGAIKMSVLVLYGGSGTDDTLTALWTYCWMVTAIITYSNTINVRYYLLYPREEHIGLQFETQQRKIIGNVLWTNAQTVVGIAWYAALVQTPESMSQKAVEKHRVWLLWVEAICAMFISSIVGGVWSNAKLKFEKKQKGPVQALYDGFEKWYDPNDEMNTSLTDPHKDELENDNEKDKVQRGWRESFVLEYCGQFIDLIVYALGFASGWLIAAAVKAMLVKSYEGVYDPEQVRDISGDVVWSMWLAFFIALAISVLIMTFLTKITTAVRKKKHEVFDKWKQELEANDEKIDRELEILHTKDKDDKEQKEEEEETELLQEEDK